MSDNGLHSIAWVLVAISLVLVMTVLDRQLARADRHHTNQPRPGPGIRAPRPAQNPLVQNPLAQNPLAQNSSYRKPIR